VLPTIRRAWVQPGTARTAVAFIALVLAFSLEQFRPLPARPWLAALVEHLADGAEQKLNAGQPRHGAIAWWLLVCGAALVVFLVHEALLWLGWWAALPFSVLVLYATVGFRKFSHPYKEIQAAVERGDLVAAQRELSLWKRQDYPDYEATALDITEIARQTLEYGLLRTQRYVFGVLFWYALLAWAIGPAGAVLYRMTITVAQRWNRPVSDVAGLPPDRFGDYARRAAAWVEWVPARLAALGFAIVGDFEGAVHSWRRAVATAPAVPGLPAPDAPSLLIAAASGALGTRVMSIAQAERMFDDLDTEGARLAPPSARSLAAGAALMWRALLLWLVLLALLTIVAWAP
jgi:adenosylcobinamide-phosphate synthase